MKKIKSWLKKENEYFIQIFYFIIIIKIKNKTILDFALGILLLFYCLITLINII
jgi:hypothetical protein